MINNSSVATASKTTPKEYTVKARICGHGSQECGQISDWINIAGWCLIWSVYSSQKCCWTVPEVSGGHTRHVFTQTYRFCIELMTIWPGFHRAFPTLHIGCSNDSWFGFVWQVQAWNKLAGSCQIALQIKMPRNKAQSPDQLELDPVLRGGSSTAWPVEFVTALPQSFCWTWRATWWQQNRRETKTEIVFCRYISMVFSTSKTQGWRFQPQEMPGHIVASHKLFVDLNEMLGISFLSHKQNAERSGKTTRIQPNEW
jgi:hypothetical protein